MNGTLDVRNFTRSRISSAVFEEARAHVLPDWDISLVFAGEIRAQKLNTALRKKDYIPNVLSYEAGAKSGEIIICPPIAKKQAPRYGLSPTHFMLFLFIHGLLHLKGYPHGATMERLERATLARFIRTESLKHFIHGTTHRDRH